MNMAKVDLRAVYKVRAKGREYHYAWRPGRGEGEKARLHSPPGSDAYVQELALKLQERSGAPKGTLHAAIAAFRASAAYTGVSDKLRANWAPYVDAIQVEFGHLPIAAFDRPLIRQAIIQWRDRIAKPRRGKDRRGRTVMLGGPRAADMARQAFSRILGHAVTNGYLTANPIDKIPCVYNATRAAIIWTDGEIDALRAVSEPIWWAARLAVLTGLRQGDLLRLNWSSVGDLAIDVPTSKTGQAALIPMYGALKAHLKLIPKRSTRVLTNSDGMPWKTGFGSSWNKAKEKIGVDKHFHDLRGNAATALYSLGDFSIREIAEMMAWTEEDVEEMINRYVKRDEILRDRIRRIDQGRETGS